MSEIKEFDLLTDELNGATLLEASAGTGKTYSVAMLALRLILEKNISVKEILLVTFTNAATAELKERLRLFIIAAKQQLNEDVQNSDSNIHKLLKRINKNEASERLNRAINELDELQVFTIHSFLNYTTQEFAFETGMRFNYELVENQLDLINDAVKTFWREKITPISKEFLAPLISRNKEKDLKSSSPAFSFEMMASIVRDFLSEKKLPAAYYSETELKPESWDQIIEVKNEAFWNKWRSVAFNSELLSDLYPEKFGITNVTALNFFNREGAHNYFIKVLNVKKSPKWPSECRLQYGEENLKRIQSQNNIFEKCKDEVYLTHPFGQVYIINSLGYQCFKFVEQELRRIKEEENIKHTDELVNDFYEITLNRDKLPVVQEALSARYKAFFIDEFQDTDAKQSAVFTKLFTSQTIQYFVGDPKQSIYGFRGADVDSYVQFKTDNSGLKIRSLPINYRSTQGFVDACNYYFKRPEFSFRKKGIEYKKVTSKSADTGGDLSILVAQNPMTELQKLVLYLLEHKTFVKKDGQQKILPENIAILTRGGKEAKLAKQKLAEINVPAVVLADQNVFQTQEAQNMRLFCELLIHKKLKDFKRLLLSNWFNVGVENIKNWQLDEDANKLMHVYTVLEEKGFYAAFQKFYELFRLETRIQKHRFPDRITTNTNQLVEIIHTWISQEKLSLYAVVKRMNDSSHDGQKEYEEQIESDLPSVKIMTIHKSKGLEFDVVICPDFPKKKDMKWTWNSFAFKLNGESYFVTNAFNKYEGGLVRKRYFETQFEENARLEYVAVTRAKQAFYGIVTRAQKNYFGEFVNDLTSDLEQYDPINESQHYKPEQNTEPIERSPLPTKNISKTTAFAVSSFSDLSVAEHKHYEVGKIEEEGYDQFIFNQLKKGADAGNLIHEMFEIHDFNNGDIAATLNVVNAKYPSYLINDDNLRFFEQFMQNVLEAKIPGMDGFTLSQLRNDKRICEMAFHWKADDFKKTEVQELLKDDEVRVKYDFDNKTGYIKGFIDFIFEHQGKYYILDWKSNHIGSSVENYTQDKMDIAMKASNYHLQHYIYKKAFMSYLASIYPEKSEQEIQDKWGGVIYSFVRGCRNGQEFGMFVHD